ncbi:MAG: ABC transporter permease [Gammaproteobacteria bacterium]|nr:MAG: ABC transporter permease [Gammaproteobacteria bacterium]
MRPETWNVARKELEGFFASPAAWLFLGAFLAVTLFVFFWVETFFARNIADVKPLFQWMPVLLIFLVAALTMRSWAEERRAGTLEVLLTAPVSPWSLILGKFLAAWLLVALALVLTLPLPLTVAFLGPLDWGPVLGGYLAALFLAAAYIAMGLWVSSRAENQIVSLILGAALMGAFYLVGSELLTGFVGYRTGEWLRAIGVGARFQSITRGVLDLRDLYYYLSLTGLFLVLGRYSLERLRWAGNPTRPAHRAWAWITGLVAVNLLAGNLWLGQIGSARADLTAGQVYTLSEATRSYLARLREPLLIRGYFSAATHPLLAPLVPQLHDLLEEYAVAGGDRVHVAFVDPHDDPKVEKEAASRYGIRPVPFQTASKYQASVVNAYFHILVAYGDQYQVLGYRDLIDIKARSETDLSVELKNPEYRITQAIRKVLDQYQGGGNPFANLGRKLVFTGYVSTNLPKNMQPVRKVLDEALDELKKQAGDRLQVQFQDPDKDPKLARRLTTEFGFQPMIASLLEPKPFWFSLSLSDGRQTQAVPLPEKFTTAAFKRSLLAAVKRFSPGFLKTLAVFAPGGAARPAFPGMPAQGGKTYQVLRKALKDTVRWVDTDLGDGRVPADADMLMVLAPGKLDEKQRFAIDQFLMRGGSVLLATAPMDVEIGTGIDARKVDSGLADWLAGYGLKIAPKLVLDTQAGALPIPVERSVGGFMIREIQLVDYPYILDVRGDGLNPASPVTNSLDQLYVPFAAPIEVDAKENQGRKVTELLRSSQHAWTSDSLDLIPDFRRHGRLGFAVGKDQGRRLVAVMLEGRFDSAFKGKKSPLLAKTEDGKKGDEAKDDTKKEDKARPAGVLERSPDSARLILVASNVLFTDTAEALIGEALGTRYLKPALFAQNLVDWSLEDQGLLALRGRDRSRFARTLRPMDRSTQAFWEYLDYGLALAGLLGLWWLDRRRRNKTRARYAAILKEV